MVSVPPRLTPKSHFQNVACPKRPTICRIASWGGFAFVCFLMLPSSEASAQLFGARSFGQPFQPRGSASGQATGTVQGNERFIRGNRSRRDFVGSDRTEQTSFVGSDQAIATGRVLTAAETLRARPDMAQRVNQTLDVARPGDTYAPRLILDLPPINQSEAIELTQQKSARLQEIVARAYAGPIEAWVEGETAILRGAVASESDRVLLETLVSFEPGIYRIQNELTISRPVPPPPSASPSGQ